VEISGHNFASWHNRRWQVTREWALCTWQNHILDRFAVPYLRIHVHLPSHCITHRRCPEGYGQCDHGKETPPDRCTTCVPDMRTPTCWWWTHRLGARSCGQMCPWVLLNRLRSSALPVWCSPPPQRSGLPSCPRILPQASHTGLPTPAIVSLSAPE